MSEELVDKIKQALTEIDAEVRFESFIDGVLTVSPTGGCAGCFRASLELKDLIGDTLMQEFPEIEEVNVVQRVSDDTLDFARKLLSKGEK